MILTTSKSPIYPTFHSNNTFNNRRKGHNNATYADNLFLPFALLLESTFLPLAELILALNP
jgi:hypothetical protein